VIVKIDDIGSKQHVDLSNESLRQGRLEPRKAFGAMLEEEIGSDSHAGNMASTSSVLEVHGSPNTVSESTYSLLSPIRNGDITQVQAMENTLSDIEASLAAVNGEPKGIESIIQSLTREAEALKSEFGSISSTSPLGNIAGELEILAYVESIKWSRGDYL
jgi:hypothetical protein